jgi:hypothetical protein
VVAELIQLASARGALTRNVIFVHGLDADPRGTWTSPPPPPNEVWPKWLVEDVEGLAVWSVGYGAPVSNWRGSAMELSDRAANVLSLLLVEPDLREGRLIFVGHSLSGLVIKQVLRKSADAAPEHAGAYNFRRARAQGGVSGDAASRGGFGRLGRPAARSDPALGGDAVAAS